ncbi:MAG TPA: hypothetical protein DDZ81_26675 [Acetobacteraceae bacterium]|jgi:UDP:flavonoid glycosyltransferase YjiC (YdhE family)|nr:hypothetical protein [Acetobacteraceae bacterium]
MSGKRVLLAAEFLRGPATLTRILPLADALAGRGHDVSLAVPGGLVANIPTLDAPRWSVPPPPGYVALSYSDLLMHGGYAAPDALRGLMAGWQAVIDQAQPDLLIADFAPTAMLAARVAGVSLAAVGDGFSLPPLTAPFASMRPWDTISPDALGSLDGRVLAVVNAVLAAVKAGPMRALRDLFDGVPVFLCGFPELDHYPGRTEADWYGQVFAAGSTPAVDLDPGHPARAAVTEALSRIGSGNVVVCQGIEAVGPALLAGKPVLMLPIFLEQTMTLHRVTQQGLGRGLPPGADADAIEAAVRGLLDDDACRQRVANFARAYHGYQPAIAIDAVADEIDSLLSG